MKSSTITVVTNGISELIYSTLKSLEMVQVHPGGDVDMMDDELRNCKERYYKLISIRSQFECACSGAIIIDQSVFKCKEEK